MSNTIEQNICDAVDILVNRAISQANFDKTISAIVVECVDEVSGRYKVRYQEGTYYATSDNAAHYGVNTEVYVLIPGGDFSKEKKIIGSVKNLGKGYGVIADGDEGYSYIGTNVIDFNGEIGLCSYKGEDTKILYQHGETNQLLNINIEAAEEYFKKSTHIIAGARFKTNLAREQKNYGNYGLIFTLEFLDDSKGTSVLKDYIIDVDNMLGQPFNLITPTRQIEEFEINGANFKKIEKITLFAKDFPNKKDDMPDDIFMRDIELTGAEQLNPALLNSYYLSILTPQGTFFSVDSNEDSKITLKAEAKYQGKALQESIHKMEFYWFREHTGVDSKHRAFCSYGGQGWECLNDYNIISAVYDEEGKLVSDSKVEWISGKSSFEVSKKESFAKETKYKCICLYNNMTLANEIIIKNNDAIHEIKIESSNGTEFSYDKGETTLTCKVDNEENLSYNYYWIKTNNVGTYEKINSDEESQEAIEQANTLKTNLKNSFETKKVYPEQKGSLKNPEKYNLIYPLVIAKYGESATYQNIVDFCEAFIADKSNYYCYKNKINNLPIRTITNYATYSCSVFEVKNGKENFIGTASIKITNSFEKQIGYTLVINNGTQLFKYDEAGLSPSHKANEHPQEIKTLTFTLFDEKGNAVEEDDIRRNAKVTWKFPAKETLLLSLTDVNESDDNYKYSTDTLLYTFDISPTYNVQRNFNDIELEILYQGKLLKAKTDFTFLKEGNIGANGTDYICRIVPNIKDNDVPPELPMIIYKTVDNTRNWHVNYNVKGDDGTGEFGTLLTKYNTLFKVELYKDGEKVELSSDSEVTWSFLRNRYNSENSDGGLFNITEGGKVSAVGSYNPDTIGNQHPAHIVKVEVIHEGKRYIATQPLVMAIADTGYDISLAEGTGFTSVMYASDGTRPSYDSTNPFKIVVKKKIGEDIVDYSLSDKLTYEWSNYGWVYSKGNGWINTNLITPFDSNTIEKNEKKFQPDTAYDGQCVSIAVECQVLEDNDVKARIHIPVHYYFNRYGLAALNDWDGNSISIDKDGNGMILSPQVGAGKKNDDNSFTGVLIGTVDDVQDSSQKTGLLGYAKGVRSIFLDAETGKAEFGTKGSNQIIIDPSSGKAEIKSGNYNTSKKTGMLIDFSTPKIEFGSGNFSVNNEGKITAKGGGSIAGWSIGDRRLTSNEGAVGIASIDDKIDGTKHGYAFWAGNRSPASAKFSVGYDGHLKSSSATIGGWTINKDSIFTNADSDTTYSNSVKISSTTFGATIAGQEASTWRLTIGNKFGVTKDGNIHASGGRIAGWTIDQDSISTGVIINDPTKTPDVNAVRLCKTTYASKVTGRELSYLRFNIGSDFGVDQNGTLYAKGAYMDDVHLNKLWIGGNYVTLSYASIQVVTGATLSLTKGYDGYNVFSNIPPRGSFKIGEKTFWAFTDYPSIETMYPVTGGDISLTYATKSFAYLS